MHACVLSHFSHVQLIVTPWTITRQAPLSMGFSRQEYWSGLLCLPPGESSGPRDQKASLRSPALADGFFTTITTWEASLLCIRYVKYTINASSWDLASVE